MFAVKFLNKRMLQYYVTQFPLVATVQIKATRHLRYPETNKRPNKSKCKSSSITPWITIPSVTLSSICVRRFLIERASKRLMYSFEWLWSKLSHNLLCLQIAIGSHSSVENRFNGTSSYLVLAKISSIANMKDMRVINDNLNTDFYTSIELQCHMF